MTRKITILEQTRPYNGFFKIDAYRIRQEADGRSFEMVRELFERGHAAAVLLYDEALDSVLLVEEFRIGYLAAGYPDAACFNMGPVAGIIDAGETPLQAAIREAREEADVGICEEDILAEMTILPSPGGSSERVTLFLAKADLSEVTPGQFGVGSEAEQTWRHVLPREEAMALISSTDATGHLTSLLLKLETVLLQDRIRTLEAKLDQRPDVDDSTIDDGPA